MRVYMLRADSDRYKSFIMPQGGLYEFASLFKGTPIKRLPKLSIALDPDSHSLAKGDFPSLLPSIPIFSARAVELIEDILKDSGELLPIRCGPETYFVLNVTRIIDALDESNSEIIRFEGSSRILNIHDYVFVKERLVDIMIFKIPQMTDHNIFVTDQFLKRVKSARLKGFWFPLLWSSE
jgi:hypothetical protein